MLLTQRPYATGRKAIMQGLYGHCCYQCPMKISKLYTLKIVCHFTISTTLPRCPTYQPCTLVAQPSTPLVHVPDVIFCHCASDGQCDSGYVLPIEFVASDSVVFSLCSRKYFSDGTKDRLFRLRNRSQIARLQILPNWSRNRNRNKLFSPYWNRSRNWNHNNGPESESEPKSCIMESDRSHVIILKWNRNRSLNQNARVESESRSEPGPSGTAHLWMVRRF